MLMDATQLFPSGYPPLAQTSRPDRSYEAPSVSRLQAGKIDYYFVDFGISVQIPFGADPKQTVGRIGLDRDTPELSATVPYDPFKVDVFLIGNFLRRQLLTVRAISSTSPVVPRLKP